MSDIMQCARDYCEMCRRFDKMMPFGIVGRARDCYRLNVREFTDEDLTATGFLDIEDDVLTIRLDERMGWPTRVTGMQYELRHDWEEIDEPGLYWDGIDFKHHSGKGLAEFTYFPHIRFKAVTLETAIIEGIVNSPASTVRWDEIRLDVSGLA